MEFKKIVWGGTFVTALPLPGYMEGTGGGGGGGRGDEGIAAIFYGDNFIIF